MKTKRMTGKDYWKEMTELNKSIESLKAHVESRLLELIAKYPDGVVVHKGGDPMLSKHITKIWFQNLSLEGKIRYIQNIEKWSASKQGSEQLTIDKIYKEAKDNLDDTLKKLND